MADQRTLGSLSLKRQAAINRRTWNELDGAGREAWTRLIDQEIHTLGEAARRDEEAFLELVGALLRAGHEVDAAVRALAGLDVKASS
jgi:hypothetical protein